MKKVTHDFFHQESVLLNAHTVLHVVGHLDDMIQAAALFRFGIDRGHRAEHDLADPGGAVGVIIENRRFPVGMDPFRVIADEVQWGVAGADGPRQGRLRHHRLAADVAVVVVHLLYLGRGLEAGGLRHAVNPGFEHAGVFLFGFRDQNIVQVGTHNVTHADNILCEFSYVGNAFGIVDQILGDDDVSGLGQRVDTAAAAVGQDIFYPSALQHPEEALAGAVVVGGQAGPAVKRHIEHIARLSVGGDRRVHTEEFERSADAERRLKFHVGLQDGDPLEIHIFGKITAPGAGTSYMAIKRLWHFCLNQFLNLPLFQSFFPKNAMVHG
ncbi:hypothetical protein SDC9_83359 [bioreactor metagenome]|uniref:Uncharacterized protein n=1 Tax=bioreactor metagenome TaxID=1076179 RepID=A0A644Z7Z5_9ZZZZ